MRSRESETEVIAIDQVRVLIVDDHPLARLGIETILSEDPAFRVVGYAADGLEAVEKARELTPDVVLMDINLPGQDGLAATRQIKEEMPSVRVVIVTVSDDAQDLFEAIRSGAQGYLLKNLSPEDWTEYLHAVVQGEARISKKIAQKILGEFRVDPDGQPEYGTSPSYAARGSKGSSAAARPQGEHATSSSTERGRDGGSAEDALSQREYEILRWVAKGASNKEIAQQLFISENTVKNHLKNILAKLHLRNRVQLATYAVKQGMDDD